MTPRRSRTLLLVAATVALCGTTLLAGPAHGASAGVGTADETAQPTPLTVQLQSMSPSTVPSRGRLTLTGTITNSSEEEWQDVRAYPFVASSPITTRDELEAAVETDPDTGVGTRLAQPNQFAVVGDLAPGASTPFRISLRRADLPIRTGANGVYWIGVHALGANAEGRDLTADGRARTFIPLVGGTARTSAALVVPLRAKVRRDSAGRLADEKRWTKLLSPGGRLDRVVGLATSSVGVPVNWLVDPAVLDAAQSMAAGNPRLALDTPSSPGQTPSPSASASASPDADADSRLSEQDRANATGWLSRTRTVLSSAGVLGLGYADPDVAGLARQDPKLLQRSTTLAATRFDALRIPTSPVVSPPEGWLDQDALKALPTQTQVLLSDHGQPQPRTQWRTSAGQPLVLTDAAAASGGPTPTPALDALAERQRILSEAALRAIAGEHAPMVVSLPARWDPGSSWRSAAFLEGLRTSWLSLVSLSSPPDAPSYPTPLPYPDTQRSNEIGSQDTTAARALIRTGRTLANLLRNDSETSQSLAGAALAATSYNARGSSTARIAVDELDGAVRSKLAGVKVVGRDLVTLSGGSGELTATLVNGLEEPVTVGLRVSTSTSGVHIETPPAVRLGPGQRSTLRLHTDAKVIGVHEVTLTPVTTGGDALGTPLQFSLRTSQVGKLIWYILIAGAALLVVMIARRIAKRVRDRQWRA